LQESRWAFSARGDLRAVLYLLFGSFDATTVGFPERQSRADERWPFLDVLRSA
jgi:hypothetical protein